MIRARVAGDKACAERSHANKNNEWNFEEAAARPFGHRASDVLLADLNLSSARIPLNRKIHRRRCSRSRRRQVVSGGGWRREREERGERREERGERKFAAGAEFQAWVLELPSLFQFGVFGRRLHPLSGF